jgi:ABC-type glycerol-3-phosphate transport system permease component
VLRSVDDGGQGFLVFLRNSAVISVSSMVVTLGVSILGASAIARLEFFGRRQVHYLFLAIYLFPAILLAIPLFVFFTRIACAARCSAWSWSTPPRSCRSPSTCSATTSRRCPRAWRRRPPSTAPAA